MINILGSRYPVEAQVCPTDVFRDTRSDVMIDDLPTFDNTKLSAINTCPTWGLIRYDRHRAMQSGARVMALECGEAMHQVFAALRFFVALDHYTDGVERHRIMEHGARIFGDARWHSALEHYDRNEDRRRRILGFANDILESSGFYDDPRDKRRTLANMEEATIAYADRIATGEHVPYVTPRFVGIEQPIDMIVSIAEKGAYDYEVDHYRFVGIMDGLEWQPTNPSAGPRLAENKTAWRLDEAWEMSFYTSHQLTGYLLAVSALTGMSVNDATVYGVAIPLPKTYDYGGIATIQHKRKPYQYSEWLDWFIHTTRVWRDYRDDPLNAPKYTHSCNRFFRPCSFIPLCASPPDERRLMFDEMDFKRWNPLDKRGDTNE